MFEFLCLMTGVVIASGAIYAYYKTRDGVHPAIVISPLLFYAYASGPIFMNWEGGLEAYFQQEDLVYVALIYLLTTIAFYIGLLTGVKKTASLVRGQQSWAFAQTPQVRRRLYGLAIFIGLLSVIAYWSMINNVGGFVSAYSKVKGGGHADSGYVGEAILLSFPAIMLLALSRIGEKVRARDIFLALLFASPHLLQGTFGGRRGPIFLVLAVLFLAWYTAKGRTPSLKQAMVGISVAGMVVLLVWSQRQHMHLGAEESSFQSEQFTNLLWGENVEDGNTYVAGVASIITSDAFERFYWGYRYFVTFIVRPIPKQLWPTKYEDMGADWVYGVGDGEERTIDPWEGLGFRLPTGIGTGSYADGYVEFSWGVIGLFYVIGLLYSVAWRRHRLIGGFWTVLLVVMLILSIYLATQSVTAWGHRLLYIGMATFLVWRYWLGAPMSTRPQQVRYAPRPAPHMTMASRRG